MFGIPESLLSSIPPTVTVILVLGFLYSPMGKRWAEHQWPGPPSATVIKDAPCNCASHRGPIAFLDATLMHILRKLWKIFCEIFSFLKPSIDETSKTSESMNNDDPPRRRTVSRKIHRTKQSDDPQHQTEQCRGRTSPSFRDYQLL